MRWRRSGAPPPAPMIWKKGGGGEGKGEEAGGGAGGYAGDRAQGGATAGDRYSPSWGERSPPPRQWDRGRDIASACLRPTGSRQAGAGGPRGMTVTLRVLQVIRGRGAMPPLDSDYQSPQIRGVIIGH